MIGALSLATGIAPSVLWREDAEDLATLVELLAERANGADVD